MEAAGVVLSAASSELASGQYDSPLVPSGNSSRLEVPNVNVLSKIDLARRD